MEKKKPIKVFKVGGVRAAIWENTVQRDGRSIPTYSIQIDRTYKQDDNFKRTSQFNVNDLPKVRLVEEKAYEFLSLKEDGQNEQDSNQ